MATRVQKFSREANFLSFTLNITIALFGFASFALLARSFPMELFGEWVLYVSASALIDMIRYGITQTAVVRYLSGAENEERYKIIGSSVFLGIVSTLIISLTILVCHYVFSEPIKHSGYELFFTWYPLLAFVRFPYQNSLIILQADLEFKKMLFIKSFETGVFFLLVASNFFLLHLTITQLIGFQIIINLATSFICIFKGWDGLLYLGKTTVRTNKILLDFGKYTSFTLIGSNLLKSADTLIISLSPLGTAGVALYSIPLKLTEIQQIPLRSFISTAFPKMSKASMQQNTERVKELFYTYSGAMTILFFFICFTTFVFSDLFVLILGGNKFISNNPLLDANAVTIMKAFSIYGLFLPVDRMTGVCLDSINKPDKNLLKVFIMVIANVGGDLIAIFVFKSLLLVAIGSIFFAFTGVVVGIYLLDREIHIQLRQIVFRGFGFFTDYYRNFKNHNI